MPPISVVIPVHNGRRLLPRVIAAVRAECQGRPHEIIAVDDGSTDGSRRFLVDQVRAGELRLIDGPRRGVAAAVNAGIREARYPFICQIDQDVIVGRGWMQRLLEALADPDVAAAQARYIVARDAGIWARVMGRDLEQRYAAIQRTHVDHVCTGNTVYRAAALHGVGLFDEEYGYGADNDISYRLLDAGYKLAFRPDATSVHVWRDTCAGYLWQQFGVGYGRLDLVARHPRRVTGDDVSGPGMILHALLMTITLILLAGAFAAASIGLSSSPLVLTAAALLAGLTVERSIAGLRAWRRCGDRACLAFPVVHLLRDAAWTWAIFLWSARSIAGIARVPAHSMRRTNLERPPSSGAESGWIATASTLVVIPAFNEVANLARVLRDIRRVAPAVDVLVVNDGSTDETADLLPRLGVRWLTFPESLGVGSAVRAGVRYALSHEYEHVIRIDGDGQHRACDVGRLVAPLLLGRADAVCGSRYTRRGGLSGRHPAKAVLALYLSAVLRRRITDPTSGLWAFGPKAIRLLSRHHPTGYPEPELLLLLRRNALRFEEVAIRVRPRTAGTTTLTWARTSVALARTLLAVMVVPLRRIEADTGLDR